MFSYKIYSYVYIGLFTDLNRCISFYSNKRTWAYFYAQICLCGYVAIHLFLLLISCLSNMLNSCICSATSGNELMFNTSPLTGQENRSACRNSLNKLMCMTTQIVVLLILMTLFLAVFNLCFILIEECCFVLLTASCVFVRTICSARLTHKNKPASALPDPFGIWVNLREGKSAQLAFSFRAALSISSYN